MQYSRYINISLFFLSLNFLSSNLGFFDLSLTRFYGFILLISMMIYNLSAKDINSLAKAREIGIVLIAFLLLFLSDDIVVWLFSSSIFIIGLSLLTKKEELPILSLTAITYTIFIIIYRNSSTSWFILNKFSVGLSNITSLVHRPLSFGLSNTGSMITLIFIIFSIILFFFSYNKVAYKRFFSSILSLILMNIVYLLILCIREPSLSNMVNSKYMLFFLELVVLFLYTKDIKITYKLEIERFIEKKVVLFLIILFISFTLFQTSFLDIEKEEKNIVIYSEKSFIMKNKPEFGKYGGYAAGMFGLLPDHLNLLGYNAFWTDEIDKNILENIDVLVIVNLNENLTGEEYKNIWDFVAKGGSLLIAGDHTDMGGIMSHTNSLLKPVNIKLNFDSAEPLKNEWRGCIDLIYNPLKLGMNEASISVGASLDVHPPAFPILVAKYGFLDPGNYNNKSGSYLGNRVYDRGDHLGDIVLIAGANYGKGKVFVFGDTSSLQNPSFSHNYLFIREIITSLENKDYNYLKIISFLLFIVSILYIVYKDMRNFFIQIILVVLLLSSSIVSPAINSAMKEEVIPEGSIAYIDYTHGERFSLDIYSEDSVDGLSINLQRNGYLSLILKEFSEESINRAKILVLIAPTQKITKKDVNIIKNFMSEGGLVILSVGYKEKEASKYLLNEFGLDISNVPLGPVPYGEKNPEKYWKEPRFVDSYPIIIKNKNAKSFCTVLINGQPYNLAVFQSCKKGGLLLISDSRFLLNKNIESVITGKYWAGNIQFLRDIFQIIEKEEIQK